MQSLEAAPSSELGQAGKEMEMNAASPNTVLAESISELSDSEGFVDQKLLEEERQLAAQREKEEREAEEKEAAAAKEEAAPVEKPPADGLDQLSQLLKSTSAYTEFLFKTLNEKKQEDPAPPKPAPENSGEKKGRKRKGGSRKGSKAKKQKQEEEAAAALEAHIATAQEKGGDSPEKVGEAKEEATRREQRKLMPDIKGEMRDYQIKGVKWLSSLWSNGLNGILADQMGLGKTVQTIGFLSHLRHHKVLGPYLVLGPLSTLTNWTSEFARWAPDIPCILYHGSKQERADLQAKHMPHKVDLDFPVIVTSYEIVIRDMPFLRRWQWKYVVVDEGHRLKNHRCMLFQKLKELRVENRLLLTGTPLQNNLAELWSLLNFILPQVFTSLEKFESWFDITGSGKAGKQQLDEEKRGQVISKLHHILKPFLLRRMKADVEVNLPRKKEILLYAQMTKQQQEYKEQLLNKTLDEYLAKESGSGIPKGRLNNMLMQLRKNCNHPDLLVSHYDESIAFPPVEELIAQCGKMQLLDKLLKRLHAAGHKVLIFSQMTRMLDILEYYLEQRGYKSCRIDGSMPSHERQGNIADYNSDPDLFVFLLSTRAGGLGINLTAADTVIIYDSDWNPHQDMQAMDRCHRIGQTRPVHVYRLATAHSVECKMLEAAGGKLKLEHMVITKGNFRIENLKDQPAIQETELRAMLEPEMDERDELVQSGEISDEDMQKLMDRSDLELLEGGAVVPSKLPMFGRGFSVVTTNNTPSVLNTVQ